MNLIFGDDDSEAEGEAAGVTPKPRKDLSGNLTDFGWVKKLIWGEIPNSLARMGYDEDTRTRNRRSALLLLAIAVSPLAYVLPSDTADDRFKLNIVFLTFALIYFAQWTLSPPRSRVLDVLPCALDSGIKACLSFDDMPIPMLKPTDSVMLRISAKVPNASTVYVDGSILVTKVVDEKGYVVTEELDHFMEELLDQLRPKLNGGASSSR